MAESAPAAMRSRRARRLRRRRERLFGRILAYVSLLVFLLVLAAALTHIPVPGLRDEMLRLISAVYDREIEIDEARINLIGGVTLHGFRIRNGPGYTSPYLLEAPVVHVSVQMTPFGENRIVPQRFRLPGAVVRIERRADGVWNLMNLTRLPPEPRPTYAATAEIEDGRLEFIDAGLCAETFAAVIERFDGTYLIRSSPDDLVTYFAVSNEDVAAPVGGRLDLAVDGRPLERRTKFFVTFRGFDVLALRPYYAWLPEFDVEGGRGDLRATATYVPAEGRWEGTLDLDHLRAAHRRSGRRWDDGAISVAFDATVGETSIEARRLEAAAGGTRLEGRGAMNRCMPAVEIPEERALDIEVPAARIEDLAFLAADGNFAGEGPATGSFRYRQAGDDARWEAEVEASGAEVRYGRFFRKGPGIAGRARITGTPAGLEMIDLAVGGSRVRIDRRPDGVRVAGRTVRLEDVRRHVPVLGLDRWEMDAEGTLDADLEVTARGPRIDVAGSVDLAAARLRLERLIEKPAGVPAAARFRIGTVGDSIVLEPLDVEIGGTALSVRGALAPGAIDVRLMSPRARFDDVRAYIPAVPFRELHPFRGRGEFAGRFAYRAEGAAGYRFDGEADLARAGLRIGNVVDKPPGVPASFRIGGRGGPAGVEFETGAVTLGASNLFFDGTAGETGGRYRLYGTDLRFGEWKTFLTQRWVEDYRLLGVEGPAIARAIVSTAGDAWDVVGLVDFTPARVAYGDTLEKPPGVPMSADYAVRIRPEVIEVRNLDLRLGRSIAFLGGTIERGETTVLSLAARADLDAAEVRGLVPALERVRVGGRPAASVLRTMSDPKGRFRVSFDVTGPASAPDVVVAVRRAFFEALRNAVENHLLTIFRILPLGEPTPR